MVRAVFALVLAASFAASTLAAGAATVLADLSVSLTGLSGASNAGLVKRSTLQTVSDAGAGAVTEVDATADFAFSVVASAATSPAVIEDDADDASAVLLLALENTGATSRVFSFSVSFLAILEALDGGLGRDAGVAGARFTVIVDRPGARIATLQDQFASAFSHAPDSGEAFTAASDAFSIALGPNSGEVLVQIDAGVSATASTFEATVTMIPVPAAGPLLFGAVVATWGVGRRRRAPRRAAPSEGPPASVHPSARRHNVRRGSAVAEELPEVLDGV